MIMRHRHTALRKFQSRSDRAFDFANTVVMILLLLVFIWPLYFVLIASVSDPTAVWNGEVLLKPVGTNFEGYQKILEYRDIWIGYGNTIFYAVVGTCINLIMTILIAYPLSRRDFVMKNFFTAMFMFTMYFSGGLIPTYLVVQKLGMLDTRWALLIPNAVSFFNVIIVRTYFKNSIPESLYEAATIDGANSWKYLIRIVLPLSKPIIAVMALYYGVAHWNAFFNAMIYLQDQAKYPLQLFLRNILINSAFSPDMLVGMDPEEITRTIRLADTLKYGLIIVSSLPLLVIYPFVQKYFVKGIMIGAVKE